MSLELGDYAPDFTAASTQGSLSLYDHLGDGWGVLFSYAADFTPVSTTELGRIAGMQEEFTARGVKLVGVSADDVASHERFVDDIEQAFGHRPDFPLVADTEGVVTGPYGLIQLKSHPTMPVRTVFIVSPDKKIKLITFHAGSLGRDFAEVLRCVAALQVTEAHWVSTPATWTDGDDVILFPSVSDEAALERFPDGFRAVTPYLRLVPQSALS
jgi:alkyl hydroperoxide reductase subunit AhpC